MVLVDDGTCTRSCISVRVSGCAWQWACMGSCACVTKRKLECTSPRRKRPRAWHHFLTSYSLRVRVRKYEAYTPNHSKIPIGATTYTPYLGTLDPCYQPHCHATLLSSGRCSELRPTSPESSARTTNRKEGPPKGPSIIIVHT